MSDYDPTTPNQGPPVGQGSPVPPSRPPVPAPPPYARAERPRRGSFWRRVLLALGVLVFVSSLMLNLGLMVALASLAVTGMETAVVRPGEANQVVAVYEAVGMLDGEQAHAAEMFCRAVRHDKNVRAVVLRVDSPGGGISACDQIYEAVKGLREDGKKTLVVSMGGVAASGGYYISAPAQTIFAEPTTITGSIGVLANWPVLKGTLDKLGMKWMVVRSSHTKAWKAAPNVFEEPADHQVAELQGILDDLQTRFEDVVRKQRGGRLKVKPMPGRKYKDADGVEFTVDEVEPFNGRVFLADRAVELGLVDKVGYLKDAIDEAEQLARLSRPKVVVYSRRKGLFEKIGFGQPAGLSINPDILDQAQTPRLLMVWKVGQ